jgi:RHS repeat-associated protein
MPTCQKTPLICYRYDALDRLVRRKMESLEKQSFYCENHLVTETQGDEQISILQYAEQLLAQRERHIDSVDCTLLATDQKQTALNIYQLGLPRSIVYTPYGYRAAEQAFSTLLGFNGQRLDPVTGHYLLGNGYRAFNPILMRFNSPDSISPFGKGGLNAYAYCEGEPVSRTDDSGHFFSGIKTFFTQAKAQFLSFTSGDKHKPITHMTRISEDLAVFVDEYKGGTRLNIFGHGAPSMGIQLTANTFLGPKSLAGLVKGTGLHFESFDSARLIACHSGSVLVHPQNTMSEPFAKMFADFSGLPVKAYEGRVLTKNLMPRIHQLKVGETSARTEFFSITKNNRGAAI